jgi:hypothetical protein
MYPWRSKSACTHGLSPVSPPMIIRMIRRLNKAGGCNPSQEEMEPRKIETFCLRRDSEDQFCLDVINDAVCVAAVNAGKDLSAILILGSLEHEANVKGQCLAQMGRDERGIRAASSLSHFCDQTIRAFFDLFGMTNLGHALRNIGKLDQPVRVGVSRVKVPECSIGGVPDM